MKFVVFLLSIILLACVASSTAYSQQPAPTVMKQVPPSIGGDDSGNSNQDATTPSPSMQQQKLQADFQLKLTILVTTFGIFGLIFVAWVFRSAVTTDTEKIVRLVIVVIVVCASLILIAGGYSTNQTAPAFGLFGSIIGYILGSSRQSPGNTPANGGMTVTGNTPPTGNTIVPTGNKT
jgi:quinol-cytochrome oxidoreductase complex cytochrome b subunit